jgi:hypothetical protein
MSDFRKSSSWENRVAECFRGVEEELLESQGSFFASIVN